MVAKIVVKQYFKQEPAYVFAALSKHSTYNTAFWPLRVERIKDAVDVNYPDGVGSVRQLGLGKLASLREEIISSKPNQLIEYQLIKNPLVSYHLGRLEFHAEGEGTLLIYSIELVAKIPLSTQIILVNLKLAITLGMAKLAYQLNSE